ncbi:RNA 3'-terminal phosphate cyclase/enolpyruvate transferase [Penicillium angulare]|uniref:RNA 3'-terminal phosphate cyclase/enolpyruvate transferase n=1 Tax=Penicillium angulare TaxID=116970 RepID=UPI0025418A2B|nr:RNA 3'-terminal phosphate cyclase/enolpyruvate transferase [Penicillium angulare]KAJ5256959.1 RNA 3'-terminal phosphate cyclase/enolpyruvate transferase [Penicillium angulare]
MTVDTASDHIAINGGRDVTGDIHISGSKNAGLALMAATLLASGTTTIEGIPPVSDVNNMSRILQCLGANVSHVDETLNIDTTRAKSHPIPEELGGRLRASILILGPLVARFGYAKLSLPGGCTIGKRPVEEHIRGIEKLGASVNVKDGYIEAHASTLRGASVHLQTPSVTGTMSVLMAGCLAHGVTRIQNAALEPEVADLVNFLISLGADISGVGTDQLTVVGRGAMLSPGQYKVMEDRIEAGTFLILGAMCGNTLTVHRCKAEYHMVLIKQLRAVGALVDISVNSIVVRKAERPFPVDIETGPYPAFPTDLQPQFMVLLSLASGQSHVVETIFEERFGHCSGLKAMGAGVQINGQTAVVSGVEKLSAALVSGSDLRAAASLILAAIAANGVSVVSGMKYVKRGYYDLETKLEQIGVQLYRLPAIEKQQVPTQKQL